MSLACSRRCAPVLSPLSTISPRRRSTFRPEFPSAIIRGESLLSPDGKRLYVANRLDDTISVIDTSCRKSDLHDRSRRPKKVNALRRGERLFYTAEFAFQGDLAVPIATSTRPLTVSSGILSRTDSARISSTTARWKIWPEPSPSNGTAATRICPPMRSSHRKVFLPLAKLQFTATHGPRSHSFTRCRYRPNRYRLPNDDLTPAQERGKAIFERTKSKQGCGNRGSQPVWLLPQRPQIHKPEAVRYWLRKSERSLAHNRRAPVAQRRLLRALSARRLGAFPGRNLDSIQSQRHARSDERLDER